MPPSTVLLRQVDTVTMRLCGYISNTVSLEVQCDQTFASFAVSGSLYYRLSLPCKSGDRHHSVRHSASVHINDGSYADAPPSPPLFVVAICCVVMLRQRHIRASPGNRRFRQQVIQFTYFRL